jgi:amidase
VRSGGVTRDAMTTILDRDTLGAFTRHTHAVLPASGAGPLAGLTFGAKDLFDIAGAHTGFGSPDWLASHRPAGVTAVAVQRLLDAGAGMVGRTHTDEMAWSLLGENAHYGTPVNVNAPGRVPGGSSSGSAAAVAGGLVDFALGSDTGGSVRLPASFCGVLGIRPSHGRVSLAGACALAPSFDTAGWFSRDAGILERVGRVLLADDAPSRKVGRVLLAADAFAWAGDAVTAALADAVARIEARCGAAEHVVLAPQGLAGWIDDFRVLQSAEAWAAHGEWVMRVKPQFGPGVKERFAYAATLDPALVTKARAHRVTSAAHIHALLAGDVVIVLPTTPGIAPVRGLPQDTLNVFRGQCIALLAAAGMAGCPQITLPLGRIDGCPVGLSVIGAPGNDTQLLALAKTLA